MATSYGEIPFGLRDVKLTPLPSGTGADLPRVRSVEVSLTSDNTELTGDDTTVAVRVFNLRVEGSIEAGGINPAAVAIMVGGTVTSTGSTPNAKKTIAIGSATNAGYFKLEGQVIADDGGDFHILVYKAKVTTGPTWTFTGGEFTLTTADFTGVADDDDKIIDLVWNETATAVA